MHKKMMMQRGGGSNKLGVVVCLVALWFLVCNVFNISSKLLSSHDQQQQQQSAFWNAYTTTTAQLAFTTSIGFLLILLQHSFALQPHKLFLMYRQALEKMMLPGVALGLANLSMHWALTRTSVGMFQTAKSASPLFTAFACHFLLRRRYTMQTYLSLFPIVIGLGFASVTDLEFEPIGTLACFFSALCQVFVNLSLKSVLETCYLEVTIPATTTTMMTTSGEKSKRSLFAFEVQSLVSFCGLCSLLVLGAAHALLVSPPFKQSLFDGKWMWTASVFNSFLLLNVVLYASESVLAYSVNARLSRLPYAVVDAVRRLSIVIFSNLFFHYDKVIDVARSVNLLAVLSVAVGAITFAFVVQELPTAAATVHTASL